MPVDVVMHMHVIYGQGALPVLRATVTFQLLVEVALRIQDAFS